MQKCSSNISGAIFDLHPFHDKERNILLYVLWWVRRDDSAEDNEDSDIDSMVALGVRDGGGVRFGQLQHG